METQKKSKRYERIISQLRSLLGKTDDPISRMATINAVLYYKMEGFFWTGFYILKHGELIVGPYQGTVACQVLAKNKGVCWASVNQGKTILVEDVTKFQDHIACDPRSKSEIAVLVKNLEGKVKGVLDVDSKSKGWFDQTDSVYLELIAGMVYSGRK